ncbi:MAG: excinuclease ABC subunit UvrA [Bacteroidales bacterium]
MSEHAIADRGPHAIAVRGASEHNLKSVDVDIPRGVLAVVTGISGSGKSSLAFDTICAEGRRRYLETFSSYARQFLGRLGRPAVVRIDGLSPAVALDQSAAVSNPRSTVGTLTDIYDLLRLLWARQGVVNENSAAVIPSRALFSFNSPQGACPACKGLGVEDRLDPDLLLRDPTKSIRQGALRITTPTGYLVYSQVTLDVLDQVCRAHGFSVDKRWEDLSGAERDVVLNGSDRVRIPYGKHPLASRLRWSGITAKPREEGVYKGILPVMEQILRTKRNANILRFVRSMPCRACGGTRLRPEALAITYAGLTIADAARMPIVDLRRFFEGHSAESSEVARRVAEPIVERCDVLQRLGLGYLSLDRESTTLSTGEAQRLRLARQASVNLSNLLYVLDEPSVGLHHHDTGRLLDVLRTVRNRGNTVIVVEHDEQVMRQADWIVDIGPGAGEAGGRLLFSGPVSTFTQDGSDTRDPRLQSSRTHAYLTGRERIALPTERRPGSGRLHLAGITRHNVHDQDVEFLLNAFNVVTGVSGAGKSTLVEETMARVRDAGSRSLHAAPHKSARIDKVIGIDQAPIGRTPRSNPATYTGLFDSVRDLFASTPDAASRGFGKGRFSFNVKGGRCDACEGAGVQQVGMQFLGTVAVVCETCGGRRFNDATLEVRYRGRDIHQVLEMPVTEAAAFFADQPAICRPVEAMRVLGLGYVTLGQPATTLSGGEAQRVKLAAELGRPGTGRTLYVLDEPTTGLHAADVARLLDALNALVSKGNTVIAIEHHLDVVKSADWVVDLGPGSGADGGRIVAVGTPEQVASTDASLTGAALRTVLERASAREPHVGGVEGKASDRSSAPSPVVLAPIRLTGVSTHNLKHVDVDIPRATLTVITGVSGSGKSSLAFDTLFAEAQQRYAETFSTWARRFVQRASEAEFDTAEGLTPAIAIAQQRPSRNPRSTVATLTEIHDLYRLLFARAGTRDANRDARRDDSAAPSPRSPIPDPRSIPLTASMFSPNSEHGACPSCRGLGHVLDADPDALITHPTRPLSGGAMSGHKAGRFYGDPHGQHMAILDAVGRALGLDFSTSWHGLDERARAIAMEGAGDRVFDVEWHYVRGTRRGVHAFRSAWPGLQAYVRQEYERKHADRRGEALEPLMHPVRCAACGGAKLKPEALAVRFAGVNISELLGRTVTDSLEFFATLDETPRNLALTTELRSDIVRRLRALDAAALGYLALDRPAATLSGGEAQRVRLASQLESGLTGVTYVLDEPTAGLHPRDTGRLLGLLRMLVTAGNTVVVVEHDSDVIEAADHLIELGPGAGEHGGQVMWAGKAKGGRREAEGGTPTAEGGRRERGHADFDARRRRALRPGVTMRGATVHNLRALDVTVPFGGLVAVSGVSGSGKSSLVQNVFAPSLERVLAGGTAVNCSAFDLAPSVTRLVRANQDMAVTSPWSTPATLTGIFDSIRAWFAATDAARAQNLRARHFSTTVKGGRCEQCEGLGRGRVSMDFLPDIWTTCEICHGSRYSASALSCTLAGRSIADVLDMSVDAAAAWVGEVPRSAADVARRLGVLADIGLGYLRLGQPAPTLSGGERQRVMLAVSLMEPGRPAGRPTGDGPAVYVMDEPTLGLHARDVSQLLRVFDRLVEAGHTLVVIEHHLDVISAADWVIDLGPEGGPGGGRIVAEGPPEIIAACDASHTGRALRARGHTG